MPVNTSKQPTIRRKSRNLRDDDQAAGGWTAEARPAANDVSDLSGGWGSGRGAVRSMSRVEETPITARLPVPDVEKLEKLAAESDRSRSAEVRRAVREYVERHTEEGAGVATG